MRKLLLTIIAAFAMTSNATLNAQNKVWWGYEKENAERTADGTVKAEDYNVATFIAGDNPVTFGKTINAVRIYLRDTEGLSGLKLWLSTELPASADDANVLKMDIDMATVSGGDDDNVGKANDITLSTPYTMTEAGLYVGYSFTVTDKKPSAAKRPIVMGKTPVEGGCFLKTSTSVPNWITRDGNLAMQFLLEGEIFENAATPANYPSLRVGLGKVKYVPVTFTNIGTAGVSNFDYTLTCNGTTSEEKHIDLNAPFTDYGHTFQTEIPFEAAPEVGVNEVTLTVTKVNGKDNEAARKECVGTIDTRYKMFEPGFIVEEFTGTGCGYCPRGIVAMEKLREWYGNNFIGIAIHQYNSSDAMYYPEYPDLNFDGAPETIINRNGTSDPDAPAFFAQIEESVKTERTAGAEIWGEWSEDHKSIDATVVVETLEDNANYQLFFALIADGLTGEGSAWNQSNYYTSGNMGYPYLENFIPGGIYGQSSVSGLVFNDVAIGSSGTSFIQVKDVKESEPKVVQQNITLTTRQQVLDALQEDKVAVAVVIFDENKKFVNAAKYYMGSPIHSSIASVKEQKSAEETGRYTIDGQRINAPAKGLNIIRMSDGSTRKVIVR